MSPLRAPSRRCLPRRALGLIVCFALGGPGARTAAASEEELRSTAALAVARDPSGQKTAAMVDSVLRSRAAKAPGLRLLEPARVLSGDPRTREEATQERARAALADGRRAYDALALDDAIARLGQAVSLLQETGPLLGDLEELKVALVYLGAALTLRGSSDEGESTFMELLTVAPSHRLEGFPPTIQKAFERAGERLEASAAGGVEIYSTPPYAAVHVDGRFEGVTPLTLPDLVAGTHYVRLEKVGFLPYGAPLEIAPGQRITSQTRLTSIQRGAELRDLAGRATEEMESEGMGGALRGLARLLAADTLIFVSVAQSGRDATLTGGVFDGATGTRLVTERAVLSAEAPTFETELDGLVGRLLAAATGGAGRTAPAEGPASDAAPFGLGSPRAADGSAAGPGSPSPEARSIGGAAAPAVGYRVGPRTTPSETYLGWTLVGLGGAALITGGVFAILASDVHADFRKTSQLSPDLTALGDRGERNALVADLCFLGGGLSLIAGAAIALLAGEGEPAPARVGVQPMAGGAQLVLGGGF